MIRAARLTAGPKKSPSRSSASPVWTPIRTRNTGPPTHASADSSRCAANPAAIALAARLNTAPKPSPAVENTWPPLASIALRRISSWRANAAPIASGNESHNGVDPSMSVNRNVTVPEGVNAVPRHDPSGHSSGNRVDEAAVRDPGRDTPSSTA